MAGEQNSGPHDPFDVLLIALRALPAPHLSRQQRFAVVISLVIGGITVRLIEAQSLSGTSLLLAFFGAIGLIALMAVVIGGRARR